MTNTDPILYGNCTVSVAGKDLAEAVSVSINRVSNAQDVITILKGWAGFTPGAQMVSFSVENATPGTFFEMDPGQFIGTNQFIEITYYMGGKKMGIKGVIKEDNFEYAANTSSKLSFKGNGAYVDWT